MMTEQSLMELLSDTLSQTLGKVPLILCIWQAFDNLTEDLFAFSIGFFIHLFAKDYECTAEVNKYHLLNFKSLFKIYLILLFLKKYKRQGRLLQIAPNKDHHHFFFY